MALGSFCSHKQPLPQMVKDLGGYIQPGMVLTKMRGNESTDNLGYSLSPHSTITVRVGQDGFAVFVLGKFHDRFFLLSFVLI